MVHPQPGAGSLEERGSTGGDGSVTTHLVVGGWGVPKMQDSEHSDGLVPQKLGVPGPALRLDTSADSWEQKLEDYGEEKYSPDWTMFPQDGIWLQLPSVPTFPAKNWPADSLLELWV